MMSLTQLFSTFLQVVLVVAALAPVAVYCLRALHRVLDDEKIDADDWRMVAVSALPLIAITIVILTAMATAHHDDKTPSRPGSTPVTVESQ